MKRKVKWLIGTLAVGMVGILADALFLEKYFFEVKIFDIGNRGSHKRIKLVLLTDLHFRYKLWPHFKKLAARVNELQPELILITGDSLDSSGELKPLDLFFSLLGPNIQKVAVPGNHDHKADENLDSLKAVYQKHNCDFLVNESKVYHLCNERIVVTGLDDFIEGNSRFRHATIGLGKENHHFLLLHSPLQQERVREELEKINKGRSAEKQLNIRYIFAGHNHGGQVRLFNFVPVLPVRSGNYINGWYNNQLPFLYVSKGFGTSTIPIRFGARSELIVFNYWV